MARKKYRNTARRELTSERTYQEYVVNQPMPQTSRLELMRIINGGEDTYLELKLKLSNSDNIAQEIVAMANTDGGTIVFGVTDKLLVQGLRYPEGVQKELVRICNDKIVPPIVPLIDTVKFDNGRIIVALDVRGKNRPYRTDNGKFYIRNGSGKREIRRDQLSAFLDETRPLYYENIPVFDFETGSFDDGVLWGFLDAFDQKAGERAAYDTERVLKKDLLLGIGAGEKFLPTVAGVLLFGENESVAAALPHAGIRMSRFSGKENEATLVEQTEISGNLLHLFDAAGKFVERYCDLFKHRQKVKEAEGEDFGKRPSFHMYAINEAICNLIMHRDLALREIESEIRIYDDAIVFLNARRTNGFVPPASRAIRFGITQRINPQIAAIFKRREYGARVPNGGLPMVLKQSELFSGKKPELSTVGDVFRLKVYSR